jgi:hypothetical protein
MSTFIRRIALAVKELRLIPSQATGGRLAMPAGGGTGGGGRTVGVGIGAAGYGPSRCTWNGRNDRAGFAKPS